MNKKGVSLPVNVLVVLAIAIVVLLGLIAFFSGTFQSSGEAMSATERFNACCMRWTLDQCERNPSGVNCGGSDVELPDGSTAEPNLENVANAAGINNIEQACGCP